MDRITNIKKIRIFITLSVLFFLIISLGYSFYLYSRATTVTKLTEIPTVETSGNVDFRVEIEKKKNLFKITGWAIIQGEAFKEALSKYVLFSLKDNSFYEVRTWPFSSKRVVEFYDYSEETLENFQYDYAGMSAVVNNKQLKTKGEYKIYILFDNGITKRFFDSGSVIVVED